MKKKLDPRPARTDLTDRECTKLICGLLGSMSLMAEVETLRESLRWLVETEDIWFSFKAQRAAILSALAESQSGQEVCQ